jgi:rubrerythrin
VASSSLDQAIRIRSRGSIVKRMLTQALPVHPNITPGAQRNRARHEVVMNLHEALQTAIQHERHIRDHYGKGAEAITNAQGKKAFQTLAKEEQGHVDYLESRMGEWQKNGRVTSPKLGTILPPKWWLDETVANLYKTAAKQVADKSELDLLKAALELEKQTSALYRDMVAKLPEGDRDLFARFLEIEDGHVEIVQAELDALSGLGYWFDMPEFALEGA